MPPPTTTSDKAGHIWMVTGCAGCGKTTVASHLAETLGLPFLEGDDFHPKANIDKMTNGQPLNDADRWDWLIVLRKQALKSLQSHAAGEEPPHPTKHLHPDPANAPATAPGVVITCSALKHKYRDVIRVASYNAADIHVHFIYLRASEETLTKRAEARKGHYMKANMVHSQFQDLEEPTEEEWDVITVDCTGTQAEVLHATLQDVKQVLSKKVGEVHGAR